MLEEGHAIQQADAPSDPGRTDEYANRLKQSYDDDDNAARFELPSGPFHA